MQNDIVDRVAAIPGVTSAAFTNVAPMEEVSAGWDEIRAADKPEQAGQPQPLRMFRSISPGFFQTIGTRIVAGRDVTWTELHARRPVVLISENLAREFWGSPAAAIGKRVRPGGPWREVIGVVQDVRENGVQQAAPAIVYWPSLVEKLYPDVPLEAARTVTVTIRSKRAGSENFLAQVRNAVWSVNASVPVAATRTMQEIVDRSMARTSFTLVMLAIAGAIALILGIVGIYGVISYAVSQRRREIGIRLALGAQTGELQRMFVRHGLMLAGIGAGIGAAAAMGLTRLIASLLFGIGPMDPLTYAAAGVLLAMAAMLASALPARRAASVDPVEALRSE
jgi:predicted permease